VSVEPECLTRSAHVDRDRPRQAAVERKAGHVGGAVRAIHGSEYCTRSSNCKTGGNSGTEY
jgi:hypothetical protein